MSAGVAYGEDGVARGAMGVDAADYDRSRARAPAGRQFLQSDAGPLSQRRQRPVRRRSAAFDASAAQACLRCLSASSSSITTWTASPTFSPPTATSKKRSAGCSRKSNTTSRRCCSTTWASKFDNVAESVGADFARPIVARGAAYADFDQDGELDVLVTTNNGPAYLFRNDGGNRNHWLSVRLEGAQIQPGRHRRRGAHQERLRRAVEHGPQRIELLLAERAAADVRPGQRHGGDVRGRGMAQRPAAAFRACRRTSGL